MCNTFTLKILEGKEVMLGNEKIDKVDTFPCLGSIINEEGECDER